MRYTAKATRLSVRVSLIALLPVLAGACSTDAVRLSKLDVVNATENRQQIVSQSSPVYDAAPQLAVAPSQTTPVIASAPLPPMEVQQVAAVAPEPYTPPTRVGSMRPAEQTRMVWNEGPPGRVPGSRPSYQPLQAEAEQTIVASQPQVARYEPAALPEPVQPVAQQPARVQPATYTPPRQTYSPPPQQGAVASIPKAATSEFVWPVRGAIASRFGGKTNGERNDGINITAAQGTPIQAVRNGTVIYAGDELKSYGNLVLIRHEDGWVSAYAHADALHVKRGDKVNQGQTVASVGASGAVNAPQLHFELRKGQTPVDPLQHLPGA